MKTIISLFGLFYSTVIFSHPIEEADYSIVFGGCFEKDLISLKINNVSIFNQYKIGNELTDKGNLSLKQSADFLHLFYNGKLQAKSKVDLNFFLNIELTVSGRVSKFKFDLRKGKVLLFEKCSANNKPTTLTVEQIQEQVLLM